MNGEVQCSTRIDCGYPGSVVPKRKDVKLLWIGLRSGGGKVTLIDPHQCL